jgi:hypothetical protein
VDTQIRSSNGEHKGRRQAVRFAVSLALLLGIPVAGQAPVQQLPQPNGSPLGQRYPDRSGPFGGPETPPDQKRLRQLNVERQKSLISDAAKLLKLARELNEEMAGADSSSMTDAQMRKLGEIAKLAHNVKEKMSYSVGGAPVLTEPINSVNP